MAGPWVTLMRGASHASAVRVCLDQGRAGRELPSVARPGLVCGQCGPALHFSGLACCGCGCGWLSRCRAFPSHKSRRAPSTYSFSPPPPPPPSAMNWPVRRCREVRKARTEICTKKCPPSYIKLISASWDHLSWDPPPHPTPLAFIPPPSLPNPPRHRLCDNPDETQGGGVCPGRPRPVK